MTFATENDWWHVAIIFIHTGMKCALVNGGSYKSICLALCSCSISTVACWFWNCRVGTNSGTCCVDSLLGLYEVNLDWFHSSWFKATCCNLCMFLIGNKTQLFPFFSSWDEYGSVRMCSFGASLPDWGWVEGQLSSAPAAIRTGSHSHWTKLNCFLWKSSNSNSN
jgi:hypothetical protein